MPTTKTKITSEQKAYCYASGLVVFGTVAPEGTLFMMAVPDQRTKEKIEVLCRLSKTNSDIYIPGMPEAPDQDIALKEMKHFIKVVKWSLEPKETRAKEWPKRDFENPNSF